MNQNTHTLLIAYLLYVDPSLSYSPAILSSLYGYDNCIGGVNNFTTEDDYMEELKRRKCTVVTRPDGREVTNVVPSYKLRLACRQPFGTLEWLDGMPVTFNYPLLTLPDKSSFKVELNDGSVTSPVCVMLTPADEKNEKDTLLILGEFGDGAKGSVWPVKVSIVGEVTLSGPDGELNAIGLSYSSSLDMEYKLSRVRMVYARMWDVTNYDEGNRYPTWPLPSSSYPNNCQSLFPSTSHVVRVAFSGGITRNGVDSITPDQDGIFTLRTSSNLKEVPYLGLADLGKNPSVNLREDYIQDRDNYLDICLDLSHQPQVVGEDLLLSLHCSVEQDSALYPPKGKPYACKPAEVVLSSEEVWGHFIKTWIYRAEEGALTYKIPAASGGI